ncbi:DUF2071 domain-containing protein [Aeoliella mucimassa]|uniref:DUF2071 domain-containing protein n=1 Tax=Aeoliella mucimassa TaxID=2527972 RepID=A0A518ANM7_9BACT|nr:DUF2071 domain-containing protein [Aeoliella mucimassa]QDU56329.1 hypothetical protein Pan181_25380 [Aeoliella mucimassa]
MRIPTIQGIIDRRILANYRCDPAVMQRVLPPPFRPQLVDGYAIGGICLIRLKQIRPAFLRLPVGIRSENAAHRIAVEWDLNGQTQQGVYIPRRDTDSRLNAWAGGTLFPGIHHHGSFRVQESSDHFSVEFTSDDHAAHVAVVGRVVRELPAESVFQDLEAASAFFEAGSLGYSDTATTGQYDGLELRCSNWQVEPLAVERVESSFFEDEQRFPPGSTEFDCALLMRGIYHQWQSRESLCCPATEVASNSP